MNITARTCANCALFNPAPEPGSDDPICESGATFTERPGTPTEVTRHPIATDTCPDHMTDAEDVDENYTIIEALREGGPLLATIAADACESARIAIRNARSASHDN